MLRFSIIASAACGVLAASPFPPSARAAAADIVAKMPLADVLNLTSGFEWPPGPWEGTIRPQPQFGLPHFADQDGPQGVGGGFTGVTAWPSAMTVACGWDVDAALEFGQAMGVEQRAKGVNVMLGPAINLARIPWGGRLFEYLGGEVAGY